jgi:hypothetical protein
MAKFVKVMHGNAPRMHGGTHCRLTTAVQSLGTRCSTDMTSASAFAPLAVWLDTRRADTQRIRSAHARPCVPQVVDRSCHSACRGA